MVVISTAYISAYRLSRLFCGCIRAFSLTNKLRHQQRLQAPQAPSKPITLVIPTGWTIGPTAMLLDQSKPLMHLLMLVC